MFVKENFLDVPMVYQDKQWDKQKYPGLASSLLSFENNVKIMKKIKNHIIVNHKHHWLMVIIARMVSHKESE